MPIILKARNIVRTGSNLGQHPFVKSVIIWRLYHSVLFQVITAKVSLLVSLLCSLVWRVVSLVGLLGDNGVFTCDELEWVLFL